MKKLFYNIGLIFTMVMLLANSAKAQLPLVQGDAVVTHSPAVNYWTGANSGIVLRVIKTSNTTSAPWGHSWNTSGMTPAGLKPGNYSAGQWTQTDLGTIFGITLDRQPNPNIYVSSTQIYNAGVSYARKVYCLSGTSGAKSLVYDFGDAARSLGNLKYCKIGGKDYIYVSDFQNGRIYRLTGTLGAPSPWVIASSVMINAAGNHFPYGLALRKMSGGAYRLYFAEIEQAYPYGTNKICYIDLSSTGDFTGTIQTITTPTLTLSPTTWASYTHDVPVIADMDFTADGSRMLIGQQTWAGNQTGSSSNLFAVINPHNSNVIELADPTGTDTWSYSGHNFPAGSAATNYKNCVGGVCYSNNILQKGSNNVACDTTVWFTSDYNVLTSPSQLVYGIQGMSSNGGTEATSILVDEDEDIAAGHYDKTYLGDVEVVKAAVDCSGCTCGSWQSNPTLNGNPIPGVPVIMHPFPPPINPGTSQNKSLIIPTNGTATEYHVLQDYPIQFVQGNVSGLINANYKCGGKNCSPSYAWTMVNATNAVLGQDTTQQIDLSKFNNLSCGTYTLTIKVKCGGGDKFCDSQTIPVTIICEPPSCCKATIDVALKSSSISAVINIPNPNVYSTANFNYTLNYNVAMSEVRVSVEDFKLVANSPNCLNCNNRPVTWGNILSATLNGTVMALTGAGAPATGSLPADYREAVYSTGTPLAPNSAGLNIKLSLPAVTELSCCQVSAYVCLKFTFKDTQCRECVQMVCGSIKLVPTGGGGKDDSNQKTESKKFEVFH